MILSITKKLLSDKFIKQGIFETLWLTVIYWNKVNLSSLRHFLKIESRQRPEEPKEKKVINTGKFNQQARHNGAFNNNFDQSKDYDDSYLNYGDFEARQQQRITKYETKKGFDINLTSAGFTQQLNANGKDLPYDSSFKPAYRPKLPEVAPPFLPPHARGES